MDFSIHKENLEKWYYVNSLYLNNYMGAQPNHFPIVAVKVAYSENALYVKFNVYDQFIKCVNSSYQSDVWKDSCVEFFFVPSLLVENGYFNLEMNCGGNALFHFQKKRGINEIQIEAKDFNEIELFHSLPKYFEAEITKKTEWILSYKIPFRILKKYYEFEVPTRGDKWLINFYKCADETSHPHWLTWSFVDKKFPDFHIPEYFGELQFD
jgi:hypothetical protein